MSAEQFMLKELLEIFHDIEREKDKMLKANPNLEKEMTALQGIDRKHVCLCDKLYKEKTRPIQITLGNFFNNNKKTPLTFTVSYSLIIVYKYILVLLFFISNSKSFNVLTKN